MSHDPQAIAYWASDLQRLAKNLEKDLAAWSFLDTSSPDVRSEQRRRSNALWTHAQRAGVVLFKLCGLGAFDQMPRIKNHICQIRTELKECLDTFEVRPYHF